MRHLTEWSPSWDFIRRLEQRSSRLPTARSRAFALRRSAELIPQTAAWKAFGCLCVLTIAGVSLVLRSSRIDLAVRVSHILTTSECATIVYKELIQGHGPAYIRVVLGSRPGDLYSRCCYPLEVECGATDEDMLGRTSSILDEALPESGLVVARGEGCRRWMASCRLREMHDSQPRLARLGAANALRYLWLFSAQANPVCERLSEDLEPMEPCSTSA